MEVKDWDFFMVVFVGSDRLQHFLWDTHLQLNTSKGTMEYNVILRYYELIDSIIGEILQKLDENTISFIVSDHGFTTFRRGFNLNTWLLENGFIRLRDPSRQGKHEMFVNVDWSGTKAYGLGMT